MVNNPYTMPGFGDSYDHEYDKREARDAAVEKLAESIANNLEAGCEVVYRYANSDALLVESISMAIWEYAVRQAEKEIPH